MRAPVPPATAVPRPERRLSIPPAAVADVLRLEREVGVSHAVAQVLVRRGLAAPEDARAWLAGAVRRGYPVLDRGDRGDREPARPGERAT